MAMGGKLSVPEQTNWIENGERTDFDSIWWVSVDVKVWVGVRAQVQVQITSSTVHAPHTLPRQDLRDTVSPQIKTAITPQTPVP